MKIISRRRSAGRQLSAADMQDAGYNRPAACKTADGYSHLSDDNRVVVDIAVVPLPDRAMDLSTNRYLARCFGHNSGRNDSHRLPERG